MTHSVSSFTRSFWEIFPGDLLPVFTLLSILAAFVFFLLFLLTLFFFLQGNRLNKKQQEQLRQKRAELHESQIYNTRLVVKLENDQKLFTEKLTLLQEARDELKVQFTNLAGQIFDDKSKKLSELNREKLDTLLSPFNRELCQLRTEINAIYNKDSRERFALKQEISQLQELNRHLGTEAKNLTMALKGENKTAGNWGEMVLEKLLEISGLRKGIEFTCQSGHRGVDNQLLRPDVIVHLPDKRDIIIDAKTSLLPWCRYLETDSPDLQQKAMKELLVSLRSHITGLSKKDYPGLKELHSLDFVLMFIPVEAAFAAACGHDTTLIEEALSHNVILVSPTTLLPTLRTVQNIWKFERQEKNAQEIAHRATLLYDKFRIFLEEMEKLGKQLDNARNSYESAIRKLSEGQGNLISQAIQLKELGVQPKKELPSGLVEKADHKSKS